MYNLITNPHTGKKISIYCKEARDLLQKFITFQYAGAALDPAAASFAPRGASSPPRTAGDAHAGDLMLTELEATTVAIIVSLFNAAVSNGFPEADMEAHYECNLGTVNKTVSSKMTSGRKEHGDVNALGGTWMINQYSISLEKKMMEYENFAAAYAVSKTAREAIYDNYLAQGRVLETYIDIHQVCIEDEKLYDANMTKRDDTIGELRAYIDRIKAVVVDDEVDRTSRLDDIKEAIDAAGRWGDELGSGSDSD